jgi:hypothetical protein
MTESKTSDPELVAGKYYIVEGERVLNFPFESVIHAVNSIDVLSYDNHHHLHLKFYTPGRGLVETPIRFHL